MDGMVALVILYCRLFNWQAWCCIRNNNAKSNKSKKFQSSRFYM